MMTKTEFAKMIVEKYVEDTYETLCFSVDDNVQMIQEDLIEKIYTNSGLAVALEFLGYITDEKDKEYVKTRSGSFIGRIDYSKNANPSLNYKQISVREMLSILPD